MKNLVSHSEEHVQTIGESRSTCVKGEFLVATGYFGKRPIFSELFWQYSLPPPGLTKRCFVAEKTRKKSQGTFSTNSEPFRRFITQKAGAERVGWCQSPSTSWIRLRTQNNTFVVFHSLTLFRFVVIPGIWMNDKKTQKVTCSCGCQQRYLGPRSVVKSEDTSLGRIDREQRKSTHFAQHLQLRFFVTVRLFNLILPYWRVEEVITNSAHGEAFIAKPEFFDVFCRADSRFFRDFFAITQLIYPYPNQTEIPLPQP